MKHLLLASAASLLTLASYAQNTVTLTQSGANNSANSTQTGNLLTAVISQSGTVANTYSNTAISVQTGTAHSLSITQNTAAFNRAAIGQAGTSPGSNSATISQSNGSGGSTARSATPSATPLATDGNWAGVAQSGSSNKGSITQDGATTQGNFAETWQKGTGNRASTNQNGATNGRAEIFQGDDTRSGTPEIPPGIGYSAGANSNTATVDQSSSQNNTAYVRQFSNSNTAFVRQIGANSQSNIASVLQGPDGASNTATIRQGKGSDAGVVSNTATISQLGTNSFATVDHDRNGGATSNVASISQTTGSSSNTATITQSSGSNAQFNVATIQQAGQNSFANIYEDTGSKFNTSSIRQGAGSNGDQAYISHAASNTSTASITQNLTATTGGASNNIAAILQDDNAGSFATSMTATISQEGKNNSTQLIQSGTGHKATLNQTGNNNTITGSAVSYYGPTFGGSPINSYALQSGTGQVLTVDQTSSGGASVFGNTLNTSQTGTSNTGTVTQFAGTGSNIGNLTQGGTGNFSTISQTNGILTP